MQLSGCVQVYHPAQKQNQKKTRNGETRNEAEYSRKFMYYSVRSRKDDVHIDRLYALSSYFICNNHKAPSSAISSVFSVNSEIVCGSIAYALSWTNQSKSSKEN